MERHVSALNPIDLITSIFRFIRPPNEFISNNTSVYVHSDFTFINVVAGTLINLNLLLFLCGMQLLLFIIQLLISNWGDAECYFRHRVLCEVCIGTCFANNSSIM